MQKISDIRGAQANTQGKFIEPDGEHPGPTVKEDWFNIIQHTDIISRCYISSRMTYEFDFFN